jgi:hypothetical protein
MPRISRENSSSSREYSGAFHTLNRHYYPKAFQSFEQGALYLIGMATVEEIGSQLPLGLFVFKHVRHTDQDGMCHGDTRALLPFAGRQPPKARG